MTWYDVSRANYTQSNDELPYLLIITRYIMLFYKSTITFIMCKHTHIHNINFI